MSADPIEQYEIIIKKLFEKTVKGDLVWAESWSGNPETTLGGYQVVLESANNAEGEPIISVRIANSGNEFIDGFSDETLSGRKTNNDDFPNYWKMMERLHQLAWRTAKGADKAIAAIIDDLDYN